LPVNNGSFQQPVHVCGKKSGANMYPWQTPDSGKYTAKIDANLRLVKLFNHQYTNTSNIRVLFHTWSW